MSSSVAVCGGPRIGSATPLASPPAGPDTWPMAWQDDLAGAAAREHADVLADAAAIAEAARGRTRLADRLRASSLVRVHCVGGVIAVGEVLVVADDIIEIADGTSSWLLAPEAIATVADLPSVLPPHVPVPTTRVPLTWGMALRPWTGAPLTVHLRDGASSVYGQLGAVGADHLDVLAGTADDMTSTVTVPFSAIAAVRCG